jgi:hypothetical protein
MADNRTFGFNNPEKQEIYDLLIEAGVKPSQAFQIANAPNSTSLSDDALAVLSQFVTDDRGYFIVNNNLGNEPLGQYGNITDMVDYFATDEGNVDATRLFSDQVSYLTALNNKATYNTRVKDYNARVKDYVIRRKDAETKVNNPLLIDEGKARAQSEIAKLDAEASELSTELQSLNDEYQTFADWGLMNQGVSDRARPELSRMASTYDERGLRGASGAYYLSKDDMEWGEQAAQEAALAKQTSESEAMRQQEMLSLQEKYRAINQESPSAIYTRNLPQGLSPNQSQWNNNAYSDIYGEFLANEKAPQLNETQDQTLLREVGKNSRWEEFLKKYNYLQKYKGIAPVNRGDYSGRLSPKTRVLNY